MIGFLLGKMGDLGQHPLLSYAVTFLGNPVSEEKKKALI